MQHEITDEMLESVGILAKLDLDGEEREETRKDMKKMLEYIDLLNEVDTTGVEPMGHGFGLTNVFREDIAENMDAHEDMLENAPVVKDYYFVAPKTI